jgi:hypothetical protein
MDNVYKSSIIGSRFAAAQSTRARTRPTAARWRGQNFVAAQGVRERRDRQVFAKTAHDCTVLQATHLLGSQCDVVRPLTLKVGPSDFAFAACHRRIAVAGTLYAAAPFLHLPLQSLTRDA